MAVATLIPQNAPREGYLKVFGTLLGPLIARTTLQNIYGSWWFVGAFAVLALNLSACSIQRAARLLARDREELARLPEGEPGGQSARLRSQQGVAEATKSAVAALKRAGYAVATAPAAADGGQAILASRGRVMLWAPVIVHVGMVVILIGAAWGRLPSHSYQTVAILEPGQVFAAKPPGEAFGLRLNDAGIEHGSRGVQYWAKMDVLEEGQVIKSQTVQPNRPLRYHGVSVALQSIGASSGMEQAMGGAGWQVQVKTSTGTANVPILLASEGRVDMMESALRLDNPPWLVFVSQVRDKDEAGHEAPAARVFIDRSGSPSHNFELVGWVGTDGLSFEGLHFQLVAGEAKAMPAAPEADKSYAQFSLDRDIGVPVVFLGFIVISLGAMLMLGPSPRRIRVAVTARGRGAQVAMSVTPASDAREAERIGKLVQSELGGSGEGGAT